MFELYSMTYEIKVPNTVTIFVLKIHRNASKVLNLQLRYNYYFLKCNDATAHRGQGFYSQFSVDTSERSSSQIMGGVWAAR